MRIRTPGIALIFAGTDDQFRQQAVAGTVSGDVVDESGAGEQRVLLSQLVDVPLQFQQVCRAFALLVILPQLNIHPPKKLDRRSRELMEEFGELNPDG
jgi:hypothetical protein